MKYYSVLFYFLKIELSFFFFLTLRYPSHYILSFVSKIKVLFLPAGLYLQLWIQGSLWHTALPNFLSSVSYGSISYILCSLHRERLTTSQSHLLWCRVFAHHDSCPWNVTPTPSPFIWKTPIHAQKLSSFSTSSWRLSSNSLRRS